MFHNTRKKQIILIRHAKALELDEFDGDDFSRPLHERGASSAKIIARYLRLIGVHPDRVYASPSARTLQSAEILSNEYRNIPLVQNQKLYHE
jgi:phosphohistidine phosphatase